MENLLSQAKVYGTDQKIISIVQEETAAFFIGQKTAEATAQLGKVPANISKSDRRV